MASQNINLSEYPADERKEGVAAQAPIGRSGGGSCYTVSPSPEYLVIGNQYKFNVCCVGNEKVLVLWEFIGDDGNPLTGKDSENPLRTGGSSPTSGIVTGDDNDPCVLFQVHTPPTADMLRLSVICFSVSTRRIVCSGQTHINCIV